MGNSVLGGCVPANSSIATVTKFYTSAVWIDGRAEDQLNHVAGMEGVKHIAAFPDLHPGKYGPVGCAILADRIYPQLVGNDIGCGMSLFQLDLAPRKIKLEKAVRRLRELGDVSREDYSGRLRDIGLADETFATALGTIGGGNHFCELQTLAAGGNHAGLDRNCTYLLVHSGSRGFGNAVFASLPQGAFAGLDQQSDAAKDYVAHHNRAVLWASLNRKLIAERAAAALRGDIRLIVDAPHNLLSHEPDGWLHRKGAAKAATGLVPLAGSRATPSYLLQPALYADGTLQSCAHGAGRKYDRTSMHGRVRVKKSDVAQMQRNPFGGRIICEDKALLIEETPQAYKSSEMVVAELERTGVARCLAKFHPLVTFKKTRNERRG